jgi:hypothetical protein
MSETASQPKSALRRAISRPIFERMLECFVIRTGGLGFGAISKANWIC